MDLRWHKVALSVQYGAASLHVDCNSIETKPLEPRGVVSTDGHTLLGVRASDAGPVQVWAYAELEKLISKREEELLIEICRLACSIMALINEELLFKVKRHLNLLFQNGVKNLSV